MKLILFNFLFFSFTEESPEGPMYIHWKNRQRNVLIQACHQTWLGRWIPEEERSPSTGAQISQNSAEMFWIRCQRCRQAKNTLLTDSEPAFLANQSSANQRPVVNGPVTDMPMSGNQKRESPQSSKNDSLRETTPESNDDDNDDDELIHWTKSVESQIYTNISL